MNTIQLLKILSLHIAKSLTFYILLILKIYRILLIIRLFLDQLILFNQYKWPLSIIRLLTNPFFRFWKRLLPKVRLPNKRLPFFEVQMLIALNVYNKILVLFERFIPYIKKLVIISLNNYKNQIN